MTASTEPAPRTQAAIDARRAATNDMVARVHHALTQMRREHAAITVAATARRARVSRTFLYQNRQARELLAAHPATSPAATPASSTHDRAEATWRERALNAEDQLKHAYEEITLQRVRIGEHLGHIRDLEADLPADGIERLLTESRALRDQVHQLGQDNRRLEERLASARENNRFLDKRIANLEIKILDKPDPRPLSPA